MMGCQISGSREARSVFCSHSMRQIAVNTTPGDPKAERGFVGKLGGWGSGEGGYERSHNVVFGSAQRSNVTDHSLSQCCIH